MAEKSRFRLFEPRGGSRSAAPQTEQSAASAPESVQGGEVNSFGAWVNINVDHSECVGAPYSPEAVQRMARNPMTYIRELRRWAKWAYYANGTVTNAIDSLETLHSLDYIVVTKPKRADVARGASRDQRDRMNAVLRSIRYKEVIRNAIHHAANEGMYVGYMETRRVSVDRRMALTDEDIRSISEINESGVNTMVFTLPVDYVRIIGRRNNCYEAAFDLRYFDGMSEDEQKRKLASFPKQIQDGWGKYHKGDFKNGECWLRLDWRKTIVVKIKSGVNDPFGVPFAVAALDDIDYANYFTKTKRHVLDTVNNQIYYETFPEGKDKGTSALTDKQQKKQHDTVKGALTTRSENGVSFFSLAAGTKMERLPVDVDILDEENDNGIKDKVNDGIGFSAAALGGSSTGNYATASLNLEIIANKVFTWIEAVVEELNKCLGYGAMKDADYRVEFRVLPITFANREKLVKILSDLYARGKGSLIAWIAASGVNADDYLTLMDYELDEDFENVYPVHKTSFTMTGKDAPDDDVDKSHAGAEQNPSTESTTENDGNALPSPGT
jgi:hypothetical protein